MRLPAIRNALGCMALAFVLAAPALSTARAADETAAATEEQPAEAPKKKSKKEEREERQKYAIKPRTGKVFDKVRESLDAEDYAAADKQLGKLKLPKLSPFERAQALRLKGYTAYGQEDHDAAIEHLRGAVAENALMPSDQADVLFQVAQIQAMKQRWKDVIATLEPWLATVERPNSAGYYLMALSHFQLGDLDAAVLPATKAVAIAKKPQQVWLQLLLAIHLTRKDFAAAAPVLGAGDVRGRFPGRAPIEAYGNGGFRFAGMGHRGSILCLPSAVVAWDVASPADLTPASLADVIAERDRIEVLLVGTGRGPALLPRPAVEALRAAGIGVDGMNTGAAARTYNVLLAEGRAVAAALIAVD